MGVCVWSPRLDKNHNSVRGIDVCRRISSKYGYHMFDKIEVNKNTNCNLPKSILIQQLISAASDGNLQTIQELELKIDIGQGDYDKRTALHLSTAEGQIEIVKYLLDKGVNPKCKDRWGNTPLSEIKHKCIDTNQNSVYHQIQDLLEKSIDALSRSSSVSSSPKFKIEEDDEPSTTATISTTAATANTATTT